MKRLVLTVSMVAALAACSRGGGSPAAVTEEFMRKMDSGNCTGVGEYLSRSSQAIAPKLEQACTAQAELKKSAGAKDKTVSSVNVLEQTENGDRATVRLEAVFSDGSKEGGEAITLVREDGRWKIDLLAGMGGGGGGMGPGPVAPTPPPAMPTPTAPAAPTMDPAPTPPAATDAPAPADAPEAPKPTE